MTEEEAYAQVAAELTERDLKPGLWAKALAESVGNESVAKSLYLKFRAEQVLSECEAAKERRESEEFQARMIAVKSRTVFAARRFSLATFVIIFGLLTVACGLGALIIFSSKTADVVERWTTSLIMLAFAFMFGLATAACVKGLR